jgi:rRNA-processing protein FCF1
MKILINDANILIDLLHLELVEEFCSLDFKLYTVDVIVEELDEVQKATIYQFPSIVILELDTNQVLEVAAIQKAHNGLSFEDCSIWYYSRELQGILMSGDGKLRKKAKESGIEVRGILYLFDQLLAQDKVDFELAISKINQLKQLNNRLPQKQIDLRIISWKEKKHI